jgi:hypothetical protein
MYITVSSEIETGSVSYRGPHCTTEHAREVLEGLRTAYQSLLPVERIMICGMVPQLVRAQLAQETSSKDAFRGRIDYARLGTRGSVSPRKAKSTAACA